MLLQEFNCVEVQDPPADAAAGDDADERDVDCPRPATSPPLPPLNKLASLPRKMKESQASCRNSAASRRRSCAIGCSTRPSRTSSPAPDVRKCLPCAGRRSSMPSPAQMRRHGPLHPPTGHAGQRGLSLRAVQEDETAILAIRAWLSCFHLTSS